MIRWLLPLMIALPVCAAGIMRLEGKVQNFSPDVIEIHDGSKIYKLDRKKLKESEIGKRLKAGAKLSLVVPFDAVLDIKTAPSTR